MAIKIVNALDLGVQGFHIDVDTDADNPNPPEDGDGRIVMFDFGSFESSKNPGETKAQYAQRVKREVQALARDYVSRRNPRSNAIQVPALIGQDIT